MDRAKKVCFISVNVISSLVLLTDESIASELDADKFLSRIHYYRVRDLIELLAVVQLLPEICKTNGNVCFILQIAEFIS